MASYCSRYGVVHVLPVYMIRTETQRIIKYGAVKLTKLTMARYSVKPPEPILAGKQALSEFNHVFYASSTHVGVLGRFMLGLMFLPAFIQHSTLQFAAVYRRRLTANRSLLRR